jgi:Helicase HerA, central domain/TraM recognition site of TraD and TraG
VSEPDSPLIRLLRDPGAALEQAREAIRAAAADLASAAPMLLGSALLSCAALLILRRLQERGLTRGGRVLEIGLPASAGADGAALLWSALHDLLRPRLRRLLLGQPRLAWEIAAAGGRIEFRLWFPGAVPTSLVERAVEAAWPGATCVVAGAESTIVRSEPLSATELSLSGPDCFPLSTEARGGALRLLLSQLAALSERELALVQVVVQPATARAQLRLRADARRLQAGIPLGRLERALDLIPLGPPAQPRRTEPGAGPDVGTTLTKAAQPLFRVAIRVAVAGPDRKRRRGLIHALCSSFAALEGRVGLRRRRAPAPRRSLGERRLGKNASLLSLDELTVLASLPEDAALPGLARAGARRVPPPPDLPRQGKALGRADAGPPQPLALSVADARQHLHVLGATGTGKSTLLARLILADAVAGRGAVVIDPKGDLVDAVLARLERAPEPLVVLDPERSARPVGLNVLQVADPELAAEHVVATFRRIYEQFWGPRTDDILRACVLTLARDPRLTLAEIPACLADPGWRARLTAGLRESDPLLAGFWRWYDGLSEASRQQAIGPLLNKLRAFLLRRSVRAIVGQERTSFTMGAVLDGGLLLARLPKGALGEETSRLLGALLTARVWQEALARSRLPEAERLDCALYVDEVHNYLALPRSFEDLLAEARGYRLSLCLAHQHLGQLPPAMAQALSANARTKLVFTCSPEDARALERHFAPELAAHDLTNLAPFQAACRTLAAGRETRPFTLRTEPLEPGDLERAERLRRASEARFGRALRQVEQLIRVRQLQRSLPPPNRAPDRPLDRPLDHDPAGQRELKAVHRGAFPPLGGSSDKGADDQ